MKKLISILAFCSLLAVLIPLCVKAQETAADTSSSWIDTSSGWKVRVNGDGILYTTEMCKVFVPRSGKPLLQIIAIDPDWEGKKLEQVITLEIDRHGKIKIRDQRFKLMIGGRTNWLYLKTKGYNVFSVKYRELALKLPPEVRKLFYGFYGI